MRLGRSPNGQLPLGRVARHCIMRLHTDMSLGGDPEPVLPNVICFLESFLNVTPLNMTGHVYILFCVFVDLRSSLFYRFERIEHSRQTFVFDLD